MTTRAQAQGSSTGSATADSDSGAFSGEVAEYYAEFRRGYPSAVLDALQTAFTLDADAAIGDLALDLGCGTGQLALPLATRVRTVIGMDPEPDMLRQARAEAARRGVGNALWVLGSDTDVPALHGVLPARLGLTVIGNAVHWMRYEELFRTLRPLTRPGGGVAVIANGTPIWAQETDWSRALRTALEDHFGGSLATSCGTAADDRERYARALTAAGFADVHETTLDYAAELTFEQLLGSLYSAIPAPDLPAPPARPAFAARLRAALPPGPAYPEQVRVSLLTGRA
ncbi:methyltransferase domain-containing protein [Kitasatospora sp. NPDC088351]|uniref:class I SAM-dependent methyltransferase n=1 Tax=Kitasatospora sp. NPDC088351 TaxID=3155180 RepID=UPI0034405089